jgi:glutathione S-transferase
MQLIGMLDSPYVRRCAVSMALLGIPFEHRSVSVFRHMDAFRAINPLVKAPTLVCDDGTVLHDSNLILQYVEALANPTSGKSLWPQDGTLFTAALRITANALVAMEKTVQCVYEHGVRPPEKLHQPWLDRVTGQLQTAYDLIETDVAKAASAGRKHLVGDALTQADISVAVAWGFTQFTQAERVPKSRYPAIATFAERMETMPEFVAYPVDRE